MKDDDPFRVDAVKKKGGPSPLEQQKAFYDNLYGGKSPEEIQAAAKANYDKIHGKNVNATIEGQQFNQTYNEKVETMKAAPKLDIPVVGFDFGKKAAEKIGDAIETIGAAVSNAATTVQTVVTDKVQTLGVKVQDGLESLGLTQEETPDKQPEKVATKDQTINHEEVVDDQKKATTGGVANTHVQNDGDEKVSIKEQDKTFDARSAYSSAFGDNAAAKGNVTAAGGADSGYSGGQEQPNKGQK